MLVVQIVTGVVLAMHYTPHVDHAFNSVEHIMRDVNWGWLLRYAHAVGASMFFLAAYVHMFRGLYYGSYKDPREVLWILGVIILLLMIMTGFMGYVLPWGQMSFWAATVITNLFSAIPVFGESIVTWLWGGYSVGNPTLNRFYSLHYLLPFVIVGLVILHVCALHVSGQNNPTARVPWLDSSKVRSASFRPFYRRFFWLFAAGGLGLGWLGSKPAEGNYVLAARVLTAWYFLHFLIILPLLGLIEKPKPVPASISEAILRKAPGAAVASGAAAPER